MNNSVLKQDMGVITERKEKLKITKGDLSGNSIDIVDNETGVDFGNYLYYNDEQKRNEDFESLTNLLN